MCSNRLSHVQNTNAFSYALLWRVVYSSQFYCLTSRYFGALSILTGKADIKDFAVLVFTWNAHWIWSDNFWSRDSAPPMAVGEKHRLYSKKCYLYVSFLCVLLNHFIWPFYLIWWLIYLYTTHLSCSLGDHCSDSFVNYVGLFVELCDLLTCICIISTLAIRYWQ